MGRDQIYKYNPDRRELEEEKFSVFTGSNASSDQMWDTQYSHTVSMVVLSKLLLGRANKLENPGDHHLTSEFFGSFR